MTHPIAPSGRLELGWTNKHLRLLSGEDGGYEWTSPGDYRVAEVRLLHSVTTVGQVARKRANDNLLIRGDALHALTSLRQLPEFASVVGSVKQAYIDPPFNTGQAFGDHYDDALEHSIWLTMMRDRLVQIYELLRNDGTVWVHLDDVEAAYCKVLLDEIFGRGNFLGTIIWEKSDSPRMDAKTFSVRHDYIHVYGKTPEAKIRRLPYDTGGQAHYNKTDEQGRPYYLKPLRAMGGQGSTRAARPNLWFSLEAPDGSQVWPLRPDGVEGAWRWSPKKVEEEADRIEWVSTSNGWSANFRIYGDPDATRPAETVWPHAEVGSNRTSKAEIKALFPEGDAFATPKPERLIARILELGSEPGDIVLDCFAGSGTTAAVAHKMGRRWITVERSHSTVAAFTSLRLEAVVAGTDRGGISDDQDWEGGGGCQVLDVAPSMFAVQDERIVLAGWAVGGALSECVAAQAGFAFDQDDPPFTGRKGRQRLAVVDGLISPDVLELLVGWLDDQDLLTVYGTAVDPACRAALSGLRRGSVVRRIPQTLLDDYRSKAGAAGRVDWPSIALLEPAPVEVSV